jgi:hypothetical protein
MYFKSISHPGEEEATNDKRREQNGEHFDRKALSSEDHQRMVSGFGVAGRIDPGSNGKGQSGTVLQGDRS